VAGAEERKQVVLAEAEQFDITDDHHLVILDIEQRPIQQLFDVLVVSAGKVAQRLLEPLGRVAQALAFRIVAELRQDAPHGVGDGVGLRFLG
jgi:hypothetical protein